VTSVRRLRAATAVLLVAAVAALVATGVSLVRPAAPAPSDGSNVALVDGSATAEVADAVERGFAEILVYDYRHPHRAERAAAGFLTGDASQQYQKVYDALAASGPRQKLIHRSTVAEIGVRRLTEASAELLVFLEQETIRTTDGQVNRAPAQIRVEAVRADGTWQVSSIELL
jgi:Mce-associated membrane protein